MTKRNSIDKSASNQHEKRGNRKLTQAEFLDKVQRKHPDLDFSQAIYVNAVTKVKVVCREHGPFFRTPNSLDSGGCPTCGKARCGQYRKKSFTTFVAEANAIHNSKFEYDAQSYKGMGSNHKIRVKCPTHGWFSQYATNHMKGHGCSECSGFTRWNTESFFSKCKEVHRNKFLYPKQKYINMQQKIAVVCPAHGAFEVKAQGHLQGNDCQKCASVNSFGFSKTDFLQSSSKDGRQPLVYVVRCFNRGRTEVFYKIGITCEGVKLRFQKTQWEYEYDVLYEIEGSASYVFDLEKRLHSMLKGSRYLPLTKFNGYTECFTTIKPIEKLLKELSTTEQLQLLA